MKKYMIQYKANAIDCEATVKKARESGLIVKPGGGRPSKGGVFTDAQITFYLRDIDSRITVSPNGRIEVYYSSRPNLEKCVEIIKRCCVTKEGDLELCSESPIDPLDRAFQYIISENWNGTELRCAEAKVDLHQWLDLGTGAYLFQLPDKYGRIAWPGANYAYEGYCTVRIIAVDRDDEWGNRVVTAEKLMGKMIKELKRIVREHPRVKFQDGRAMDFSER